ncbi:MAG: succinylglutamate desuccinylase, partial [Rhodothermaeota bacterium MED-G64]
MPSSWTICGVQVAKGQSKEALLSVAKLPTYTPIEVPVFIFRGNKAGPTLLCTAGLHGDELNGIEILRRSLSNNVFKPEYGNILVVPLVNVYGFLQNSRGVPDGKDINRSFPGSKRGSLAKMLAYDLMNEVVPHADMVVDFHTGGAARDNYPHVRCDMNYEPNMTLAKAFEPEIVLHSPLINRSFRRAVQLLDKPVMVVEAGESLRFDEHGIDQGVHLLARLLGNLGIQETNLEHITKPTRLFRASKWVRSTASGLFQSKFNPGDEVQKRQVLGLVTDPYGRFKKSIRSTGEGVLVGLNRNPIVSRGDA